MIHLGTINLDVAQILAGWTALCAVLSLLNKYVLASMWPNGARAVSAVLSILPGHIGNAIEDIQAIINDLKTPPPPAAPPTGGGTVASPPKSKPPVAARMGLAAATLLAALTTGCNKPLVVPPNTPVDVESALTCVTAAVLSGSNLGGCIAQYGPALVADAIQMLLNSKEFTTAHPDLIPVLKAHKADLAK